MKKQNSTKERDLKKKTVEKKTASLSAPIEHHIIDETVHFELSATEDVVSEQEKQDLKDKLAKQVSSCLEALNKKELEALLTDIHPADLADLFLLLSVEERGLLAQFMAPRFDAEVLTYLDTDIKDQIMEYLEPRKMAKSVAQMETDDVIDLIGDLDEDSQAEIISYLPFESRLLVEEGLNFPEESAGRLMQRAFAVAPEHWTSKEAMAYLRKKKKELPDDFYSIYIVDDAHKILGFVPISKLVCSDEKVKIKDLMHTDFHKLNYLADQEDVAYIFRHYNLVSAPVIDDEGRLMGVITVDDVVEVMDEEAEEDILNLVGAGEIRFHANAIATAFNRMRWLFILMANAILGAMVINYFKGTIDEIVALAVLMPIVTSMGGNIGIQVVTVTVRGLATKNIRKSNMSRVILKEFIIASLNCVIFSILSALIAIFWFGDGLLALVLAIAMLINLFWAGMGGTLIPLILDRYKIDPAVTAGPIMSTTTDVFGFLAFLGFATMILIK